MNTRVRVYIGNCVYLYVSYMYVCTCKCMHVFECIVYAVYMTM